VLGASVYNFGQNLTIGSRGADVTALQQFLIDGGYGIPAGATGYFGAQTRAAVVAFQKARGITPSVGFVGQLTRAELNKGVTPTASEAAGKTNLSASQVDAIISVIESFGADASVVAKVRASLGR
jgi:peptidoglycan hydrolase-like protein with peptidoglycan-binding domain